MLDDRKSQVLQALVEEYIRTGEPVSSSAVRERSGLEVSSATIRNDLAKLESYGFVEQPHTSAGRIPSNQGYRYYVDHCSPGRLRSATRARIDSFFSDMHLELSRLLKDTSRLLADLTTYPAVVIGPGFGTESLRALHLIPLGASVVLTVVVGATGRVSQELVRLSFEPDQRQLNRAERVLSKAYGGATVAEGEAAIENYSSDELPDPVATLCREVSRTLHSVETGTQDVYLGGTSRLASLWDDLPNVHRVLALLDREPELRAMLGVPESGPMVRIGAELDIDETDLAVVATDYDAGEHGMGRVGVIGPSRMEYRRTIKVVEEVGEGLADSLGH